MAKATLSVFICFFYFSSSIFCQSVIVANSKKAVDSSAIFEVSSSEKGVLISRMTTSERLAIKNPAVGLMVYDLSINCLCIFSGIYWQFLCDDVNINLGLIAACKFNGNFADSSGNNLFANAFGGVAFGEDRFGSPNKAVVFDGVNDYLIVNDNGLASVPAISVSLWYKTNLTRSQQLIGRISYSNALNFSWGSATRSSTYAPINYDANFTSVAPYTCNTTPVIGVENVLYSAQTVNLGEWYHLVFSFGNGLQKIYVNGKLRAVLQRGFANLSTCLSSQIVLGSWWANDPQYFGGTMDEVRIYGRVISEKEVEQLYLLR